MPCIFRSSPGGVSFLAFMFVGFSMSIAGNLLHFFQCYALFYRILIFNCLLISNQVGFIVYYALFSTVSYFFLLFRYLGLLLVFGGMVFDPPILRGLFELVLYLRFLLAQ